MAKKNMVKYVSSLRDCELITGANYILTGDAVLGEYFEVNAPVATVADKEVEFFQPARPLLPLEKRLKNPKLGTSNIHFSLNKEIVNKLLDMGVSKRKIFIAHDALLDYIKSNLKRKSALVICLSREGTEVCVEQFTVIVGSVTDFKEARLDHFTFSTSFPNHVRKEISEAPGVIYDVKVCGPLLLEDPLNEVWSLPEQNDYTVETITPFANPKYVELYAGGNNTFNQYYAAAGLAALGLVGYFGLDYLGKSSLQSAKAQYYNKISGFEEVYSQGSAPIQLLERRNDFLIQQGDDAVRTDKLKRIVAGVARLQAEQTALEPTIDQIILNDYGRGQIGENEGESEFMVTVSFFPEKQSSLEVTPVITKSLVKALGAKIKIGTQPRSFEVNGKTRLRLTLEGTFCPTYKCAGG